MTRPFRALLISVAVTVLAGVIAGGALFTLSRVAIRLVENFWYVIAALPSLTLVVLLVIWARAIRLASRRAAAWGAALGCAATLLLLLAGTLLPFVLWAWGMIADHQDAESWAMGLGLGVLAGGLVLVWGLGRAAAGSIDPSLERFDG